ncbi:uncharacterized protein LOC141611378 [Silene latifolia]|uniref:uncharacterized protein LOC141611378 n=1 Tax=Silene latifolia TaxID=37657 RepID=UPI003D7812FC
MGINSSVLQKKSIKSPKRKHKKPIKSPKTNQGILITKPHGPPPLSLYCGGVPDYPLEFENACLVEIDLTSLKIHDYVSYLFLLCFQQTCRSYGSVACFYPNKETYERTVLMGEVVPEDMDANNHATAAINQYNNLTQNGKLKLERLIDTACYSLQGHNFFYIMFNAIDMESSTRGVYQVGMAELGGQPVLGLLRDFSNDKILAIISLKGVDDDLAVKKKNLVLSQATGSKC